VGINYDWNGVSARDRRIRTVRLLAENTSTQQRILSGFLNAFFFEVVKNNIRRVFLIIFYTRA
jgi:hypothetical protein